MTKTSTSKPETSSFSGAPTYAWANRYDKLCRIAFILIDGVDEDGKKRDG